MTLTKPVTRLTWVYKKIFMCLFSSFSSQNDISTRQDCFQKKKRNMPFRIPVPGVSDFSFLLEMATLIDVLRGSLPIDRKSGYCPYIK